MFTEKDWKTDEGNLRAGKITGTIVLSLVALIILFGSIGAVSAGERGVKTRFGAVRGTVDQGLYFKLPIVESVITMDVQTQKEEVKNVQAASQDLQTVNTNVAVNFHLEPNKAADIFQSVGVYYPARIIHPAIQESVKATTAKYTAEQLITHREQVREDVIALLTGKLQPFGITLDALNITNFDFSQQFNQAIEAKVTAEQNALAAKNKLEQTKYEAEQTITIAKAQAEAIKIQAQAINSQGGADYVQLQAIKAWDGHLPVQMIPNGSVPFINLKN